MNTSKLVSVIILSMVSFSNAFVSPRTASHQAISISSVYEDHATKNSNLNTLIGTTQMRESLPFSIILRVVANISSTLFYISCLSLNTVDVDTL